uniref:AB hydrolase-1 domain-containing protein n=1 Tax=Oryza meridionalis TaxID=40149 RepID=A0A0E0F1Y3_9ORYZ
MTYYVYKVINSTGVEAQEQTIKRVRLRLVTNMHTDAGDDFSESCRSTEHFVLVHGAGHGAWCWFRLLRLLQDSGHRVSAVDLAGAAGSLVDPNHVRSFDDYNAPLLDLMASLPAGDKGVPDLSEHGDVYDLTFGLGADHPPTAVALRKEFQRIILYQQSPQEAIFIAATMLQFGYQTEQDIKDGVPDLSEHGDVYDLTFGLGADHPPTAVALRKEFQRIILYQQSPQEDSALASILLRPWPMALGTARFTGDDGEVESVIDRVRRVYIKTANDQMVQPEQQKAMIRRWPPSKVMVMDTDHSPFFSAPELLSNLILKSLAGGLSVVHAMHLFGDRIKQAIFIAATMLQFGYQTEQDIKDGVPDLSEHGDVYDLTFGLGADHPPTAVALRKEFQRIILYQQSPQEDSALASILLRPWPMALSTARFTGDDGGFESVIDRVRRVYIKTANDRMVQPEQQEAMIRRWPPSKVMVMDTDHSPFFSAPELLFNLILKSL